MEKIASTLELLLTNIVGASHVTQIRQISEITRVTFTIGLLEQIPMLVCDKIGK